MKKIKKDTIGLNEEINRSKQLMSEIQYSTVNSGDLGNNLSADFHTNKGKGKLPYEKNNYILIPKYEEQEYTGLGHKLHSMTYLRPEHADELNVIGEQITKLIQEYDIKFNQYTEE